MKAYKLTSKNAVAGIKNPEDGILVKGLHYNNLFDDVTNILQADGGLKLADNTVQYTTVLSISAAQMIATTAGGFGHAAGMTLVPAPGAQYVTELVSAVIIYDSDGTGYTSGGNTTVNITGGSAVTGLISAANSFGATTDKIALLVPLATAGLNLTANTGLSLVTSAAFTTGGAAGTAKVYVTYKLHKINLF
jgi:hypothetical protein